MSNPLNFAIQNSYIGITDSQCNKQFSDFLQSSLQQDPTVFLCVKSCVDESCFNESFKITLELIIDHRSCNNLDLPCTMCDLVQL